MPSHNAVTLVGHLTKDPEVKQTKAGSVCEFTVAVQGPVDPKTMKPAVDFIDCQAWKTWADNLAKFSRQGDLLLVWGRLKQERWETDGGALRSRLRVVAVKVLKLRSKLQPGIEEPEPSAEVDADVPF